jgi:hypothetical protein
MTRVAPLESLPIPKEPSESEHKQTDRVEAATSILEEEKKEEVEGASMPIHARSSNDLALIKISSNLLEENKGEPVVTREEDDVVRSVTEKQPMTKVEARRLKKQAN